jgi:hypothetical protein
VSVERIFHCDGPECSGHVRTAADFPSTGFIRTYERWPGFESEHHFCTWDCLLRFAAARPESRSSRSKARATKTVPRRDSKRRFDARLEAAVSDEPALAGELAKADRFVELRR